MSEASMDAGELMSPEVKKMFQKAVKEVSKLYVGDQLSTLLKTQPPEERDKIWQEASQKFELFSEKINGLRQAIKNAIETRRAYPSPVTNVMKLYFSEVKDQFAVELLTDLLLARIITAPGYIDYGMDVGVEAEAIATELGSREGLRGKEMKSVTLEKVIEAVLTGSLKLTRQTQLKEK